MLLLVLLVTLAVAESSSWTEWSCVSGSWRRELTTSQQGGTCAGQDRARCSVSACRSGSSCCREGSVCNLPTALGWLVCRCRGGTWSQCALH